VESVLPDGRPEPPNGRTESGDGPTRGRDGRARSAHCRWLVPHRAQVREDGQAGRGDGCANRPNSWVIRPDCPAKRARDLMLERDRAMEEARRRVISGRGRVEGPVRRSGEAVQEMVAANVQCIDGDWTMVGRDGRYVGADGRALLPSGAIDRQTTAWRFRNGRADGSDRPAEASRRPAQESNAERIHTVTEKMWIDDRHGAVSRFSALLASGMQRSWPRRRRSTLSARRRPATWCPGRGSPCRGSRGSARWYLRHEGSVSGGTFLT
jgi:hypothetical protein